MPQRQRKGDDGGDDDQHKCDTDAEQAIDFRRHIQCAVQRCYASARKALSDARVCREGVADFGQSCTNQT